MPSLRGRHRAHQRRAGRARARRRRGALGDAGRARPDLRRDLAQGLAPRRRRMVGRRITSGPPLVSFDADLARGMGLKLGDTLTVNVLGRELTARIANLREIDWTSLGINFAIVLSPGSLDGAPQTRHRDGAHGARQRGGARARRHRPLPQRLGDRGQGRAASPRRHGARRSARRYRPWRRSRSPRARWCWPAPSPRGIAGASTTPSCSRCWARRGRDVTRALPHRIRALGPRGGGARGAHRHARRLAGADAGDARALEFRAAAVVLARLWRRRLFTLRSALPARGGRWAPRRPPILGTNRGRRSLNWRGALCQYGAPGNPSHGRKR